MPDEPPAAALRREDAGQALAFLAELQPDLRASALLAADGAVLATGDQDEGWVASARSLLRESGLDRDASAIELHVATPQGEVLAVREGDAILVVIAERYVLASLLAFDMRTVLRLAREELHAA